jgi:hypothetical protein
LNIRHFIEELKLKKKFVPRVIYVDYLNLLISSRIKANSGANSYTTIQYIAQELRGLAVELNLPVISATQLTRGGFSNSNVGMDDTAESFALPALADLFLAITQTDELKESGQYLVKQLKNRMGDMAINTRFLVGVDKPRMRLYSVNQDGIVQETTGTQEKPKQNFTKPPVNKSKFSDFK